MMKHQWISLSRSGFAYSSAQQHGHHAAPGSHDPTRGAAEHPGPLTESPGRMLHTQPSSADASADRGAGASAYTTELVFAPAPQAGVPTTLSYTPRTTDGEVVTDLEMVHERLSHLVIVSRDLRYFDHVHADYRPEDGSFTLAYTFPEGGPYVLFVDFMPREAGVPQLSRHEVGVKGAASPPVRLAAFPHQRIVEGLQVRLRTAPDPLQAGSAALLTFELEEEGRPVDSLEAYLGAGGHLILISEDTKDFLHAHPLMPGEGPSHGRHLQEGHAPEGHVDEAVVQFGPELSFHAAFPRPGRYKVWLQFQRARSVHTAPFVIEVVATD